MAVEQTEFAQHISEDVLFMRFGVGRAASKNAPWMMG